jgi:nucleotide-binding universal stress UspA family protein
MEIVVGYDASEPAKHALERAVRLAGGGDHVTVVSAAELRVEPVLTEGAQLDPSETILRRRDLEEAKAFLAERGGDAETVLRQGDPADAIVQVANDRNAGMIIVGHKGHNPFTHLLLGSVSHKVAHRASCDVLIVR